MAAKMPEFNWKADNLAEKFQLFKQHMEFHLKISKIERGNRVRMIMLAIGNERVRCFNAWGLTATQHKDPNTAFQKMLQ